MTKRERGSKGRPAAKASKQSANVADKPVSAEPSAAPAKRAKAPEKPVVAASEKPVVAAPKKPAAASAPTQAGKQSSSNGKSVHPLPGELPVEASAPTASTGPVAGVVSDPSRAVTVAPPAKRARASEPLSARAAEGASRRSPEKPVSARPPAGAAPELRSARRVVSGETEARGLEPAASAEPTLEVAASIAVASDRADSEAAARLSRSSSGDRLREAAAFGSSQSLLSTDYYFRQYGAHGLRSLAAEVDDFGFDPHVDAKVKPLLEAVCKRYFRVELVGAEHIPQSGRALLVANRGGALPWDGLVLRTALRALRPELSPLRWLAEDSVIHYPFMGVFLNRLGAVRACPENAERLLAQDRLVAVFPEGAQGSRKLFRDRYRLQRFGRGGYVKLALKLGVPIFPTAIIGAEETNPILSRSRLLGRIIGSESLPLTPTFPWLGLAGLLPAPVRWRIAVGEPIDLSGYGPDSADDALVVHRLNEQIRSSLQTLVDQGKSARGNALFG